MPSRGGRCRSQAPGAVEALLPFALTWVGVALAPALLAVFFYRLFNLWLPVIPGTPGLLVLKRRAVGTG